MRLEGPLPQKGSVHLTYFIAHRHALTGKINLRGLDLSAQRTLRLMGRTPKRAYSPSRRSRHLLETPFSEPLLGTLVRTLSYCKTHSRPPSENPSGEPFPRTLSRTFSEPFLQHCVAVRRPFRAPERLSRPRGRLFPEDTLLTN